MTHKHGHNPFKNENLTDEIKETEATAENIEQPAQTETGAGTEGENSEFEKLKTNFDNLNNQYLRLAADFDNYRKRQEADRENLLKFGTENALKNLIEVLDNFERGQKALENVDDCQKVKDSFNLVHKQVIDTLTKLGLEEIKAEGQEFDPNFHDAVKRTPTTEYPENTVITELQKGYKVGDKVLRPALVNVAAAG